MLSSSFSQNNIINISTILCSCSRTNHLKVRLGIIKQDSIHVWYLRSTTNTCTLELLLHKLFYVCKISSGYLEYAGSAAKNRKNDGRAMQDSNYYLRYTATWEGEKGGH